MEAAEEVTDAKLMKEALAKPGVVIRQSRGLDADHVAAAGPGAKAKTKTSPATKIKPRPSRAALAKAEKRLEDAEALRAKEQQAFEQEQAELREREKAAREAYQAKRQRLVAAVQEQADAYNAALTTWRTR